ncbi:MAG: hypothetical protein ACRDFR_02935, partial [Candidatus Limnocylindria bacterium]
LDDDGDGMPDEEAGGPLDLSHPDALTFPVCTLADVDPEGWYGFDGYWSLWDLPGPTVISNNPAQPAPNRSWPWMSYQNPGWPDPYHYCRLLDFYGVPCDPTDLGIPWSKPDAPAGGPLTAPPDPTHDELPPGSTGLAGISGSIDPEAGTGRMEVDYITDSRTPSAMRRYSGQYIVAEVRHKLVVLDDAGNELASVPIENQDTTHEDLDTIEFEVLVPVFPEAHVYQLRSTDYEFIRLDVSPNAPTVTWEPISQQTDSTGRVKLRLPWIPADADGDALTYTLLYAPDGEHWQVVAAGLTDPEYEVALDTLPGGDAPVFQVIAFDGTRAASAVSEPIDPVPGLPPTAVLGGLKTNSYPGRASVVLEASAFDPEDRTLPGDAIAWSSSLDGELGTGTELVVDSLSAGRHVITATATDSDGLTDTSSFELVIDPDVVQPQPDPAVEAAIEDLFDALAAGEDPSAVGGDLGGGPEPLLVVLALVALGAVGIGGLTVLRSRSGQRLG